MLGRTKFGERIAYKGFDKKKGLKRFYTAPKYVDEALFYEN